jgi:glycosyltransferase involved in cell wall biosynthesis
MTSRQEPLVSVVTPVYNGEPYLRECIESVLAQTYENWDYTIVNNCSTDRTLDIAREYAAKDSRIRIHCNEAFVRVIANYNIAFRQVSPQSKYCKVVAADDWLFPECLEKMVGLAEKHPGVAIVGAYGLYSHPEMGMVCVGLSYPSTVVPGGREACRLRLLGGPYVFGTATSVLFRSDIVRSRYSFYNESNFHADSEACFEFLGHHDFGFVHQILTFRRVQENSLTSFSKNFNTYLPGVLYELVKYGAKYLSEDELQQQISKHLQSYYRYLGEQVYKRREPKFWSFHREKLAALGYPLSTSRLAAAAVSYGLDIGLNPKRTVEGAVRWLRRIWSESSC